MSDDGHSDDGEPRYSVQFEGDAEQSRYLSKDGRASAKFANEDVYVGEYRAGKRHGDNCVYTFANGARYEGSYVDGLKEGRGAMLSLDGSKYSGEWKADKRHGQGAYQYPSGDVYTGAWLNGVKHGWGTYSYANGSTVAGEWSNGAIMHGTWSMQDGSKYTGAWFKNQPAGQGLHVFANGNQSVGRYEPDRKLGTAKWTPVVASIARASDPPPVPRPAAPLTVAQRFISKALLKLDHFEGIARAFKVVEGVPNLRRIAAGDAISGIFACGQPTVPGLKALVEYAAEQGSSTLIFVNFRTEPVVYVNSNSYIPRSRHALNTPMSLSGALSADEVEQVETLLSEKIVKDVSHRGDVHLYLKDTFADLPEDRKNLELSEVVTPDEETGKYTSIRSVKAVFAELTEEGADVEYKRLPIPSEGVASPQAWDELIALIRTADPNAGLVFVDQMGRGRATFGSIVATLMKRTQEAFHGSEERENPALGRTDQEGLDIQEFDESEPNLKLAQYAVIMRLVKALPAGDQVKAEVDDAIERCKVMHHAREAILTCRDQLEKEVAAAESQPERRADVEARKAFWLTSAQNLLERYAYLLIFQAYVKANIDTEYEQQTFSQFLTAKPELLEIIGTRNEGAIKEFRWA